MPDSAVPESAGFALPETGVCGRAETPLNGLPLKWVPSEIAPRAELGAAIKEPTKRIAKHYGQAIALEEKAKTAYEQAQTEFKENIGYCRAPIACVGPLSNRKRRSDL